jgi:cell division transport system permease protein
MTHTWENDIKGTLTVQMQPAGDDAAAIQARLDKVVAALRSNPHVASAEAIPMETIRGLMAPWLGDASILDDIPVPRLIDVALQDHDTVDLVLLGEQIKIADAHASVDDHRIWLQKLTHFTDALQGLSLAVVAIVLAVTVALVIYTTMSTLRIHMNVIEVMHVIGAHDSYLARQFAAHAFWLGAKGAVVGFACVVPVILLIEDMAGSLEGMLIPQLTLTLADWGWVAVVPCGTIAVVTFTARATIMRGLARFL